jgi:hypothetical protein
VCNYKQDDWAEPNELDILARVKVLRDEIALIREDNREYLSSSYHTRPRIQCHENREARLVAILEEISTLTSKRLTSKH